MFQVSSLRSLDELEPAELQAFCKRASSIYTDSSEDISSLAGSDWTQDLQPNISSIVEYFEKKGTVFHQQTLISTVTTFLTASLRHTGGARSGLQLSSRIAALRRSLERHGSSGPSSSSPHLTAQRPNCSRLMMMCEGAVRSKLPLFDKK